jgi:hypothetical protein
LTAFYGLGLWGGLLRHSQSRHSHNTSEDQEISHSSSKAKRRRSNQISRRVSGS